MTGVAKLDRRNIGALARRNRNLDHSIINTLPGQMESHGLNWRQNIAINPKPETRCWCERKIIASTWQRIRDGAGETCGRPDCKPKEPT